MKSFTIGEFKRRLPEILKQVSKGDSVILERGRRHEKVAILTPYQEQPDEPRLLGIFSMRGKPEFKNWVMDENEFLGME